MAKAPTRGGARLSRGVSKLTARLDRRVTLLGIVVLAVGAFLAYVAFQSTTGPPFSARYQIKVTVPNDAPTLRKGQAVRIGGQLAGLISTVEPDREDDAAIVTANITKGQFRPLPADTTAYVRVHSIVYETYLELHPGKSSEQLENGALLARPATFGTDLLSVVQLFDQKTREQLTQTVVNTGFGVAGRGAEFNAALKDLPELSKNLSSQLGAATSEPGAIGRLIVGADRTAAGLRGTRSDDVAEFIDSGDKTLSTIAGRSDELRTTIREVPPFQDQFLETAPEAEALLRDIAQVSGDLEPVAREVNRQLPDLNELLGEGNSLRSNTRQITEVADPTLKAARPVVYDLFPVLTALGPLNKNLDKLKATVEPYQPEIAQSGKWLADATSHPAPQGLAGGAPAARVLGVFTAHSCTNAIPKPGEAQKDSC